MPEFVSFPKIPRLFRDISISEKIDGTNAQIFIAPIADAADPLNSPVTLVGDLGLWAGSRNRWLTLESDNFGFAAWVVAHAQQLVTLGAGRHFGEWWGQGIQRSYGLGFKCFSLFHATRAAALPACVSVAPLLYEGPFSEAAIQNALERLRRFGSLAAPGYGHPEGVVVWHTAASKSFKITLDGDAAKG